METVQEFKHANGYYRVTIDKGVNYPVTYIGFGFSLESKGPLLFSTMLSDVSYPKFAEEFDSASYGRGGNSSSSVSLARDGLSIETNVSGSGGDALSSFKIPGELVGPITQFIKTEYASLFSDA